MKVGLILSLCVFSLVAGLWGGCASKTSTPAAGEPTTQKKGHWVTMAPQTGSLIPRRVWVDDNGQPDNAASMNNVKNGSAAAVEGMQNRPSFRPPGN